MFADCKINTWLLSKMQTEIQRTMKKRIGGTTQSHGSESLLVFSQPRPSVSQPLLTSFLFFPSTRKMVYFGRVQFTWLSMANPQLSCLRLLSVTNGGDWPTSLTSIPDPTGRGSCLRVVGILSVLTSSARSPSSALPPYFSTSWSFSLSFSASLLSFPFL